MDFVRSRLVVIGVLAGLPVAQFAGCTPKEREYEPTAGQAGADGSGGSNGGRGGSSGRGGGTTGGTNSGGGEAGDGAGGASGGRGGSSAGGSSNGGEGASSATGGEGASDNGGQGGSAGIGEGGTAGSIIIGEGGEGGEIVVPGCVPTGNEVCSDGVDNDCNGFTDCLVLKDQFPQMNGAASGTDVTYGFGPIHSTASFQCRSAHGESVPDNTDWGTCAAVAGTNVRPFNDSFARNAANDGLWATEVRLAFPDETFSGTYRRVVYVHSSLYGAARCNAPGPSDAEYFSFAMRQLQDAGAFDISTVRNPFVEIDFDPPVDSRYEVAATEGTVHWPSLRRRFSFNPDAHFLLITRTYSARAGAYGMGCNAMVKRVHNDRGTWSLGHHSFQTCSAVVMNKKGAGFCLGFTEAAGVFTVISKEHVRADGGVQVTAPTYSPTADNLLWRKFTAQIASGASTNLSPKCDTSGCASGHTLFIPDKAFFRYW